MQWTTSKEKKTKNNKKKTSLTNNSLVNNIYVSWNVFHNMMMLQYFVISLER